MRGNSWIKTGPKTEALSLSTCYNPTSQGPKDLSAELCQTQRQAITAGGLSISRPEIIKRPLSSCQEFTATNLGTRHMNQTKLKKTLNSVQKQVLARSQDATTS